jgi:hypothetical protein
MHDWNDFYKSFINGAPEGLSKKETEAAWRSYQAEIKKQDWFACGDAAADKNSGLFDGEAWREEIAARENRRMEKAARAEERHRRKEEERRQIEAARARERGRILDASNDALAGYMTSFVNLARLAQNAKAVEALTASGCKTPANTGIFPDGGIQMLLALEDGKNVDCTVYAGRSARVDPGAVIKATKNSMQK